MGALHTIKSEQYSGRDVVDSAISKSGGTGYAAAGGATLNTETNAIAGDTNNRKYD